MPNMQQSTFYIEDALTLDLTSRLSFSVKMFKITFIALSKKIPKIELVIILVGIRIMFSTLKLHQFELFFFTFHFFSLNSPEILNNTN